MKIPSVILILTLLVAKLSLAVCNFPSLQEIINRYPEYVENPKLGQPDDPELDMTTPEMIRKAGYPAEAHVVLTEDDYLLTMHRIPGPPGSKVVFLQHGFLCDSASWVVTGKNKSLAYLLADQGYDVWIGNARGTKYSESNLNYTTSDIRFWDFSWPEMGIYDLPAEILYISKLRKEKITYIGHSMGVTMFFVMAIEKPEIATNFNAMFSLAPVAFVKHITSPVKVLAPFRNKLKILTDLFNHGEFTQNTALNRFLAKYFCDSEITEEVCGSIFFIINGFDPSQFNYTLLPNIVAHYPSGASIKTFSHYGQEIESGKFQQYDYGPRENLKRYNSIEPPEYDLSKVEVPVGLFWGPNDVLADPIDVKKLSTLLPNLILNYKVNYTQFGHLDFLWAIDVYDLVYKNLLIEVGKY